MAIQLFHTLLYAGMLGVVVSGLAQASSKPKHRQRTFLLALLLLLLVDISGELLIYSGLHLHVPGLVGFQLPFRMLLGPALYFYAYASMSAQHKLTVKSYAIALVGPVVVICAMLPFIFGITSAQKLAMADPMTRDPELFKIALYTCLSSAIAFIFFTFAYLIAALKLHARHKLQLMDKFSEIEQRSMDWFRVILILWGLAWLVYIVTYISSFFGNRWFIVSTLLPIFDLMILVAFCHLAIKQPVIGDAERGEVNSPLERSALISSERMQLIADKLRKVMTLETLYRDEDLSLSGLSTSISVSEHHISETLSQHLNTNFFQFVNQYRVAEAKTLLLESDMLVSSIGYEVGFKSKSTFNAAFKKIVGTTPTIFKKSNPQ